MNDRNYITVVSGFGRCGSSLIMQMLDAGGIPCTGQYPAFEDDETSAKLNPRWFRKQKGRAVKVLDPHRPEIGGRLPFQVPCRTIYLRRNYLEQARSHCKFAHALLGVPVTFGMDAIMAANLKLNEESAISTLKSHGPVLELTFEDLIIFPDEVAHRLALFLDIPVKNEPLMQAQVRPRKPSCAPNLDMELTLLGAR